MKCTLNICTMCHLNSARVKELHHQYVQGKHVLIHDLRFSAVNWLLTWQFVLLSKILHVAQEKFLYFFSLSSGIKLELEVRERSAGSYTLMRRPLWQKVEGVREIALDKEKPVMSEANEVHERVLMCAAISDNVVLIHIPQHTSADFWDTLSRDIIPENERGLNKDHLSTSEAAWDRSGQAAGGMSPSILPSPSSNRSFSLPGGGRIYDQHPQTPWSC